MSVSTTRSSRRAHEIGLGDLPESCVAEVMIRLDPAEIYQLARLSRLFRGAAAADFVWVTKLPENYRYLIEKALGESDSKRLGFLTKKEIYAQLCRRNLFDEGTKEFWMAKKMGGICMSISSKSLAITGIDDRRYWNYIPTEESRTSSFTFLLQQRSPPASLASITPSPVYLMFFLQTR